MLALKGIYENGTIKFDKPINIKKAVKVIVIFIDEEIQLNYQTVDTNKEHIAK